LIRVGFQDLPQFRRQPGVFIRIALLHFSQLRDRPDNALRLDLLDLVPQLGETPDGWIIGRPARPPFDELAEYVDDTAKLATVAVPGDDVPDGRAGPPAKSRTGRRSSRTGRTASRHENAFVLHARSHAPTTGLLTATRQRMVIC
jgi:hypothetical protein